MPKKQAVENAKKVAPEEEAKEEKAEEDAKKKHEQEVRRHESARVRFTSSRGSRSRRRHCRQRLAALLAGYICAGTEWAHPCHICAVAGLAPSTSDSCTTETPNPSA